MEDAVSIIVVGNGHVPRQLRDIYGYSMVESRFHYGILVILV